MRKSFQRALLKVSVALTRLMTQMASTPTILHIQVGNLMIYLKSSSKICWEFQFSFLLPRSLWVNISVKEGRLRCWQGIFHKIKFWLHVTDVCQLNIFFIFCQLDVLPFCDFSGSWVDLSSARGLVSLLLHRVLPWMPKASSLRDLEVNCLHFSLP